VFGGRTREEPSGWRLAGWSEPDLTYVHSYLLYRGEHWPVYVPALELVPCGTEYKPAMFFKVGSAEYDAWTHTVEPTRFVWRRHLVEGPKPYVLLRLSVFLRNTAGSAIGLGGAGTITVASREALETYGHQLVCSAVFDPADDKHRAAVRAWATAPGLSLLFLLEENLDRANYLHADIPEEQRTPALTALADAEDELSRNPRIVPGAFPDAVASVQESLPPVTWWR
jgi:hypothetical protein